MNKDHNSPEAIAKLKAQNAKRKAQNAKHNPWDRWTPAEREMALKTMGGARPIVWTTDISKAGTLTESGKVYAYAGGPVEGTAQAEVKKRADGKVDGRSKGVRKCGKCGQTGHNARTCGRNGRAKLPASLRKSVETPSGSAPAPQTPESTPEVTPAPARPAVETPSGKAPKPRSMADRDSKRAEMRASKKGTRKCGKCGKSGHNARTCGKGPTVPEGSQSRPALKRSKATGRQKTCGNCGGKGHNRRTCPN